ncbi:MAG: hypothetical protein O7H41_19670 [Planctomycetota bacterium]|nr:hypothetical protein [Planctomycetota bacterium]
MTLLEILGSIGVASAVLFGLSSWLGKVWANRILQRQKERGDLTLEQFKRDGAAVIESLRKEHTKEAYVHKLQFEKEFEIYVSLWRTIWKVARLGQILNPQIRKDLPPKVWKKSPKELFHEMMMAGAELTSEIDSNRPFLHETVYAEVLRLRDSSQSMTPEFQAETDSELLALWKIKHNAIELALVDVAIAIRRRILMPPLE